MILTYGGYRFREQGHSIPKQKVVFIKSAFDLAIKS